MRLSICTHTTDVQALVTLKPAKLILTQYDYFRLFNREVLERAKKASPA